MRDGCGNRFQNISDALAGGAMFWLPLGLLPLLSNTVLPQNSRVILSNAAQVIALSVFLLLHARGSRKRLGGISIRVLFGVWITAPAFISMFGSFGASAKSLALIAAMTIAFPFYSPYLAVTSGSAYSFITISCILFVLAVVYIDSSEVECEWRVHRSLKLWLIVIVVFVVGWLIWKMFIPKEANTSFRARLVNMSGHEIRDVIVSTSGDSARFTEMQPSYSNWVSLRSDTDDHVTLQFIGIRGQIFRWQGPLVRPNSHLKGEISVTCCDTAAWNAN